MKRVLSIVLSLLLIMSTVLSVAAELPEAIDIDVTYTAFDVTVKVQVPAGVTGKMIARIIDEDETDLYAMGAQTVPVEENGLTYYKFVFKMAEDIDSGNYIVRIGNNVAYDDETFEYIRVDAVLGFYNSLIDEMAKEEESRDVYGYLTDDDTQWPLTVEKLNAYKGIANVDIRNLVTKKIEAIPTATTYPAEGKMIKYDAKTMLADAADIATANYAVFEKVVADALAVVPVADVTEKNLEATVAKAVDGTLFTGSIFEGTKFDNKYYIGETPLLTYGEVYSYFDAERDALVAAGSLDAADYKLAFDRATLLLIEQDENSNSSWLGNAFIHYEENNVITVDMTDVDLLVEAEMDSELWKNVKALDNTDIDTLIDNVEAEAENLVEKYGLDENNGGGGGSGTGGGAGGTPTITKPTTPDASAGVIPDKEEEPEEVKVTFADLAQAEWAREAVEYFAAKGVISGKAENTFAPNDYVTREEGAKIIAGAFDAVENSATCDFADVSADRWSYTYIASAVRLGIIQGDGDSFRPGDTMTREEMATIFYRLYNLLDLEITGTAQKFSDNAKISSWAKEPVAALSGAGVINGMGDGTFAPKAPVTRAQLAKVAYEIVKLLGGDQ